MTDPLLSDLNTVLLRDLDGLNRELTLYPDDASVWREVPGQPNSGGTLILHLTGNLRHFLGTVLAQTGFVRDRPAEFTTRDLTREQLRTHLQAAREAVTLAFEHLDHARLRAPFPEPIAGEQLSVQLALLHLATHLAYHLGQVDYHRRTVTADRTSAGTVSVPKASPA